MDLRTKFLDFLVDQVHLRKEMNGTGKYENLVKKEQQEEGEWGGEEETSFARSEKLKKNRK